MISIRPCFSINRINTRDETVFPLEVALTLIRQCNNIEYLGVVIDNILYMYRYILTLMVDGMRAVRGFHLDKSAASVLTTCVSSPFSCNLLNGINSVKESLKCL